MKYLVLVADYPNLNGGVSLAYVRTRNVYYKEHGIDVDVLNFSSKTGYEIDGIHVFSLREFKRVASSEKYDLLICHAPNLRNHYMFLRKYGDLFSKIVFFFHGHEVLKINEVYSKPYSYVRSNRMLNFLQDVYDDFKFHVWRKYINRYYQKLYFIFVSQWMQEQFVRWIHPSPFCLQNRSFITYNCVGSVFEKEAYDLDGSKTYDFVTIRANLDGSKYSVDIVNDLAKRHPDLKFLLIGKGEFFDHYEKAPNLKWMNCRLNHQEMIDVLNSAKCALMPTRTDAQGVMMCEMATFGIPLITSDLPVCHEVFDGFGGVGFFSNDAVATCDLNLIYESIKSFAGKNDRYFMKNTGNKELEILSNIIIE